MTRNQILYGLTCLGYWLLLSCANITAPMGGEQDKQAPRIVRSNMKDSMVNFNADKLEFEFDEFVQLKDVQNQLVISPLLSSKPKVSSHKRKITVYLPDSLLRKNTTYTLSFGNAIQDLHEGNALENLRYTFSTGAFLDSLSIEGKVYDAKTGLADTSSWVGLYPPATADSDFFHKKPFYLAKVKNGLFQITHLPNTAFTVFALQDGNANFRYDSIAEAMAFYPEPLEPTSKEKITLYLFKEEGKKLDTTSTTNTASKLRTQTTKNVPLSYATNIDTVNKTKRTFGLKDSIHIKSESVFKKLDLSKIRLYQDSILDATTKTVLDSNGHGIRINAEWIEDGHYRLELRDGFAKDSSGTDFKGATFLFKTKKRSDYGFLHITQAIDPNGILYLYKQNDVISEVAQRDTLVTFNLLTPGEYRLAILHDQNQNGHWDTGVFRTKQLPETLERLEQQIVIKANWENKVDLRKPATKK